MKTTDLFKSSRCLIRKKEVADTPEERVRQVLLRKMVEKLGFPKGLISVERGIGGRRTDIVCYMQEMVPLLLIECKAVPLSEEAIQQALGYNEKILAPFLCIANEEEVRTFWFEKNKRKSVLFLPSFKDLNEAFRRL